MCERERERRGLPMIWHDGHLILWGHEDDDEEEEEEAGEEAEAEEEEEEERIKT